MKSHLGHGGTQYTDHVSEGRLPRVNPLKPPAQPGAGVAKKPNQAAEPKTNAIAKAVKRDKQDRPDPVKPPRGDGRPGQTMTGY